MWYQSTVYVFEFIVALQQWNFKENQVIYADDYCDSILLFVQRFQGFLFSIIFLRDGRQFEASCAKTLGWLSDELGGMSERLLVSADRDVLQQQVDHHEVM